MTTPHGTLADLHERLGIHPGDLLSTGQQPRGASFIGGKNTARALQSRTYRMDADYWAGVNVLDPDTSNARGSGSDVQRVAALVTDLDIKPTGLADAAAVDRVIDVLSGLLGTRPVAVIHSGYGRQPVWAVDPDDQDRVAELQAANRRFGVLVQAVAQMQGGNADSTFDGARVWRVPGTMNCKQPDQPAPVTLALDTGYPLTVAQIVEALDARDIPEPDTTGDVEAAPDTWTFADQDCPYAAAMVAAWPTDTPSDKGRHPWLLGQATRLQAAHRNGCLTPELKQTGLDALRDRFEVLCREGIGGKKRPVDRIEFVSAVNFALDKASRLTDAAIIDTLGDTAHAHQVQEWVDGLDDNPTDTGGDDDASGDQSSWQPVDLGPILDGEWTPEHPDLMPRNDGQGLLYRGRVHSFHGESESAKSLIAQAESARVLTAGGTVAYLDFESDAASVTARLLGLGAPPQAIRDRFTYIHPDESVSASQAATEGWRDLLGSTVDLVVVDGVTDAMSVLGFNGGDPNADATGFIRRFCKRLADRTGAAVVIIDHVTKSSEGRGRFAIGGQAKMAGLTGAAYIVEPGPTPPMPGRVGSVVLRIAKDRPGGIRPHCSVRHRAGDRTQEAATITFDSTGAATIVTVTAPTDTSASDSGTPATPFQPTYLMEKVSRVLEPLTDPISVNAITQAVTGRRENIVRALDCLVTGGYVTRENGPRSTLLHRSTRPYREADWFREPVDESTTPQDPAGATASGSRLRDGNREPVATPTADRFPEPVGNQSGTSQNPPPNGHDHYLASALVTCDTCGMNALTTPCSTCRRSHRNTQRQEATAS